MNAWWGREDSNFQPEHYERSALTPLRGEFTRSGPNPTASNRQTEHRVLAGPLGRGIAQTAHADAARQLSLDGSLDQLILGARKASEIVMLTFRTLQALTSGDAFGIRSGVGNELVEPTAPPCNRCDQDCAVLGTDRADVLRRSDLYFGIENLLGQNCLVFLTPLTASNLDPRKIRGPVFADLDTTDISEDIRGDVFRHLVG